MTEELLPVAAFESSIADGDLAQARTLLREWLLKLAAGESANSIGDALSTLAKSASCPREVSIILMRALNVEDLLPHPNATNQLERLIVTLCEHNANDICQFLGINAKSQTYEKFRRLQTGHAAVLKILEPFSDSYGDLPALIASKKHLLGAMNHGVVRAYCKPFGLQDYKGIIEVLFSDLGRLAEMQSSFLHDLSHCERIMGELLQLLDENPSFLEVFCFRPFYLSIVKCVGSFLAAVRSKYTARIRQSWPANSGVAKRYPLHEVDRRFNLTLPFRNEGNGTATDVVIVAVSGDSSIEIENATLRLGGVNPGDFSVILESVVREPCDVFFGLVEVAWGEIGSAERSRAEFEFTVHAQDKNVDWPSLQYASPYSTNVAEGKNFIGRTDLVRNLAGKVLRSPMEPFYITGQKRIGKTSLALATMDFARNEVSNAELAYHYVLWGDVAHAEPSMSVKLLGEGIQRFISSHLGPSINIPESDYAGSLAPLVAVSDIAWTERPDKKFVIVIDEFDEIPQELFLQGNLAETFFANLRSLSRRKNICLILVGGENMPFIMDRQGQKLNNFARINLSYFSRDTEWTDFQQMVRKPVEGVMNWHEDAVSEVFNSINGNPYFAKIVCSGAFREAVSQRDTDLTSDEVRAAMEREISSLGSNSFAHLWQDGIPKPASEREPDILRRSRVLVAAARCGRQSIPITSANLMQNKSSAQISEIEITAVLNDFVQRNVLREGMDGYSFVLPIFDRWLREVGAQQLIADTLTEELAASVIAEENSAMIRSEEIVNLTQLWPTYRGRHIGTEEVRAWLEQVGSTKEQRLLFSLLKRTKIFGEGLVRERLRDVFSVVRRQLSVPITREKNERRRDIVITYVDGEGKSGNAYASMFAEENRIEAKAILSPTDFSRSFLARKADVGEIGAVVILDDLVATGESLSGNVQAFLENHGAVIGDTKVRVMSIAATAKGKELITRRLQKVEGYDVDFYTAETLPDSACALPEDNSGFDSVEDWEKAKALITDLGAKIDKRRPLGFGNLGLLVVFPTNVPNNTIPIIRSYSRASTSKRWTPLFERLSH